MTEDERDPGPAVPGSRWAERGGSSRESGSGRRGGALVWTPLLLLVAACSPAGPGPDGGGRADSTESPLASADAEVEVQNVIMVSMDTVRADRLQVYGYERETSPNLSALARRGVVFERARAQAVHTAPSHASLFTSLYPGAHRIVNVHGGAANAPTLPPDARTLAGVLSSRGIETAAFVSGGNLTRQMEMDRGFDVWDEANRPFADRLDAMIRWILAPERGRFFALVHTYDAHAPYVPRPEAAESFVDPSYAGPLAERYERYAALSHDEAWAGGVGADYWDGMLEYTPEDVAFLSDLYDAEIAEVDQQLRRLFELVLTGPLGADTAIVVLSDHGEEFTDHGKYQHDQLFDELQRVPLVMRMPAPLARDGWVGRVPETVELIDVAPTIAELMGTGRGETWFGRSLVPLMAPEGGPWLDRPAFSELVLEHGPKVYRSVVWQQWKFIHTYQVDIDRTWEALFDLSIDPGETRNLIDTEDPAIERRRDGLREMLERFVEEREAEAALVGEGRGAALSDEHRAQLEALGYLGGGR